jgi:hypothetical protein
MLRPDGFPVRNGQEFLELFRAVVAVGPPRRSDFLKTGKIRVAVA